MTSNVTEAFVWIWLPGTSVPVVAGRIEKHGPLHHFTYGRSWRERDDAIALSPFELPLQPGSFEPVGMNTIHSCLRDAAPDAWGRRVVGYQYPDLAADELDYLLLSGRDRIGALDFQASAAEYVPRESDHPTLDDLLQAADLLEAHRPLPPELERALLQGSSVGGARPKALIDHEGKHFIAKFGSSTDVYPVVKAEYVAMRLAALAGLTVAPVSLASSLGKDVLMIERFDRVNTATGKARRLMLSGLSLLELNEMEARYASYSDLADRVRQRFTAPQTTLMELYRRLIFNVLVGNTDDHARNHSAFWDGRQLSLTPAYDICPQLRTGQEATQAMDIGGVAGNAATLTNALSVSGKFQLRETDARTMIDQLIAAVKDNWVTVCEEAGLATVERDRLWGRALLNPYCLLNWESAG
jgi:serine/threonine-protein kinase HipA